MIPWFCSRRVALASMALILGLASTGLARAAAVLTAGSVQELVEVEDNANFLVQVAQMAGQVPQIKGLTGNEQSGLIQGSWSDVQTAGAALADVEVVASASSTNKAVALPLKSAHSALTADIANLGTAVTANPLSAATQQAFKKMGQDAQTLVSDILRAYALLPAAQRPVELSLASATGQARVFSANATVKFVLSGPKAAVTSANGTWALTSGRQDPTEPPLSTPFVMGKLTGTSANAQQAMQTTATEWGAWTYIYYQYGVRRPTLLLLNLGSPDAGNTTDGNTTDGGNSTGGADSYSGGTGDLSTGGLTLNGTGNGTLNISDNGTVTLAGNLDGGSGSVTKTGPGILVLSPVNIFAGGTTINGGTLIFSSLSDLGTGNLTFNGGTLEWNTGSTADISNQTVVIDSGGATLDLNGNNVTLASSIGGNGTGGLTLDGNGTLTLAANATYTGNTTINSGTLLVTSLYFPPGNIFVLGTGTFVYQPDGNDSLTVSAVSEEGSAYAWGNTTYEVDVQADGSWVLPVLNMQIVAITGGYEIEPWTGGNSSGSDNSYSQVIAVNAD
ncbi:MAG: autotransporter-associated beta strand repeat-containing protein, partial [Opitutales bacterium]